MEHGMEEKFIKAYEENADALFRYSYFRVFDREVARDLVQDAFTRAWDYARDGKEVGNMRALLYKILHNAIVDYVRKKKSTSLDKLEDDGFEPKSDIDDVARAEAREVGRKLALLSESDRQVLEMRFIEDMSVGDISKVLKVSENLISVRIHRALKKMKDILDK